MVQLYSNSPLHSDFRIYEACYTKGPLFDKFLLPSLQFRCSMAINFGFLVCLVIIAMDITVGIFGIEAKIAEKKVRFESKSEFYKYIFIYMI